MANHHRDRFALSEWHKKKPSVFAARHSGRCVNRGEIKWWNFLVKDVYTGGGAAARSTRCTCVRGAADAIGRGRTGGRSLGSSLRAICQSMSYSGLVGVKIFFFFFPQSFSPLPTPAEQLYPNSDTWGGGGKSLTSALNSSHFECVKCAKCCPAERQRKTKPTTPSTDAILVM